MNHESLSLTDHREIAQSDPAHASDLAADCQRQIERLNPTLNAFITVIPSEAALPSSDTRNGLLYGIPIAVKDLYETKGIRSTSGSKFFADHIPQEDALVVQKIKQAGAQIIGKTNTHEIALGVTNNNPHFGACRNPWDITRTPGGSSGGSAVAVATGMALAALGTDTGGSIRIPASLCGVVGLKPTYGRVSLRGILPLSWNLDHAGPLTRRVEDAALMLQVMSGYDELDPASSKTAPDDFSGHIKDGVSGLKIGLAVGSYIAEADSEVLEAAGKAARILKEQGATIIEVNTDFLKDAALANGIMTQADGAAFHRERMKEHPDWFGADVRLRLETGAAFTSSEYSLARRTQAEVMRQCELLFEEYDLLLLPTTPIPAPVLEGENAIERARQLTRFTAPFNLTGLPAISVPCGLTKVGLPIGLQIVSRAWNEAGVLRAGYAFQEATQWHEMKPKIAL
ncbi:MAG: Asp-tRNA(Asn)/Glu-tRNA(Gln) amidotransferase subunit GatA [Anaerolineales bacterium]|nr:Asp-tRNA(Asn)/Glu-tRNA(Gln) amidotransferase subunit GatA [Anaerolineales bacterium]